MSYCLRSLRWSPLVASLLLCAPSFVTDAHAQTAADRATARELGNEGQAALDKKDYATAEDRFRRADALFHAPTLLLGYARAEAGLGKVVNASEAYNRIVREGAPPGAPAVFLAAVEAAKAEAVPVQARIASVTISVAGPDNPTVMLDDQPVPVAALGVKRPVDPGAHVVKATADGWQPGETKFTVADAATATAVLTLTKSAAPVVAATGPTPAAGDQGATASTTPASADTGTPRNGSTQRTIGLVAMGAGVVGLGVGAVTGVLAIGKHSTLAGECKPGCDTTTSQSDLNSYHSIGMISTIGFIAGGVLAAGGAVSFFTAPHGDSASAAPPPAPAAGLHVTPVIGLGTIGAVGTF